MPNVCTAPAPRARRGKGALQDIPSLHAVPDQVCELPTCTWNDSGRGYPREEEGLNGRGQHHPIARVGQRRIRCTKTVPQNAECLGFGCVIQLHNTGPRPCKAKPSVKERRRFLGRHTGGWHAQARRDRGTAAEAHLPNAAPTALSSGPCPASVKRHGNARHGAASVKHKDTRGEI